jgi:hypothetical protein
MTEVPADLVIDQLTTIIATLTKEKVLLQVQVHILEERLRLSSDAITQLPQT